jgi:hypothetical protein
MHGHQGITGTYRTAAARLRAMEQIAIKVGFISCINAVQEFVEWTDGSGWLNSRTVFSVIGNI